MTFDSRSDSTLDLDLGPYGAIGAGSKVRQVTTRHRANRPKDTLRELVEVDDRALDAHSRDSTISSLLTKRASVYELVGDKTSFFAWATHRRISASIIDLIARQLGQRFDDQNPRARLVTDVDDSRDQIILLVAQTNMPPADAVDALLEFTGSDWWMRMVWATQGGVVVDVECR